MKANMNSIVRITVTSSLPELKKSPIVRQLVDKSATWDSFLRKHGIILDPAVHYLSALHGKVKGRLLDKIGDVTGQYRNRVAVYNIKIMKLAVPSGWVDRTQPVEVAQAVPEEPIRTSGRKRKHNSRYTEDDEEDTQEETEVSTDLFDEDPLEVPSSSVGGIEEEYTQQAHGYARGFGTGMNFAASEIASQASQDTFDADVGEDIKGVIMEKLRHWATNGDLYRMREELRVLQANRKSLKVARYIPYTMNVLGVLFGNGND